MYRRRSVAAAWRTADGCSLIRCSTRFRSSPVSSLMPPDGPEVPSFRVLVESPVHLRPVIVRKPFSGRLENLPDRNTGVQPGEIRKVHEDPQHPLRLAADTQRIRASRSASPPAPNRPTTVSTLSARATRGPGHRRLTERVPRGRVVGADADRQVVVVDGPSRPPPARPARARRRRPSPPAAPGTPPPCRWPGRPCRGSPLGALQRRPRRIDLTPSRRSPAPVPPPAPTSPGSCRAACGTAGCRAVRADRRGAASESASQKKRASRRRATSTRSALSAIRALRACACRRSAAVAAGSSPGVLVTARKCAESRPCSSTTGK